LYFQSRVSLKRLKPGSLGEITVEIPESSSEKDHLANALKQESDPTGTIVLEKQTGLADLQKRLCDGAVGWIRMPEADIDEESRPILMEAHPTLFLQFADLRLNDQKAVEEFVKEFGLLGSHKSGDDDFHSDELSETLDLWILLQLEFKTVIRLWRGIRAAGKSYNTALLELSLLLDKSDGDFSINDKHHESSYSDFAGIERLRQQSELKFPSTESAEANNRRAVMLATEAMTKKLNNLIAISAPALKLDPLNEAGVPKIMRSGIMSLLASQNDNAQAVIEHNSLFGAISLQLLEAINQDSEFNMCLECFKWMTRSKKGSGGNLYCGSTCRNKASRRRRALTLLLDARPEMKQQLCDLFQIFSKATINRDEKDIENLKFCVEELSRNTQGQQSEQIRDLMDSVLDNYKWHLRNLVFSEVTLKHFGLSDGAWDGFLSILSDNWAQSAVRLKNELQPSLIDWSYFSKDEIESLLDSKDEV